METRAIFGVNQEVRNVDGVRTSKVSLKDRQVTIFADEKVKNEALVKAIEKLNYSAKLLEELHHSNE